MQALSQCAGTEPLELRLTLESSSGFRPPRRQAWAASVLLHVAGITALMLAPPAQTRSLRAPSILLGKPALLVAPPAELTQRDPNRGKIGREFDLESLLPRQSIRLPRGGFRLPPGPTERAIPGAELPEPPKLESQLALGSPAPLPIPPPEIQPVEKPRLAFERPGLPPAAPATGRIPAPSSSVGEAVRAAAGSRGGGLVVGDADLGSGGVGEALNLPPAPGRQGSALELLSDPMGVDFKPYLIQILAIVRRNWYAVIPEVARLGRPGKVVIQFAIGRDGQVPKLVIVSPSGTEALDRAAVAGISASNPFPPLPADYRGLQIRVQFTFLYNMPRY